MFYQYFFKHNAKINRITRKITGIIGHDKIDDSILKCKNLNLLSNKVALKYRNMLQYFDGKTDSCSEELNSILQKIKTSEKFSPTYLFIRSLYVFSILADDLASAIYRKNFEYKYFYIDDKRYLTEKIYK